LQPAMQEGPSRMKALFIHSYLIFKTLAVAFSEAAAALASAFSLTPKEGMISRSFGSQAAQSEPNDFLSTSSMA